MELKVFWTVFAEDKLNDIFEYYKFNVSVSVAQNLIKGIVNESLKLKKNSLIGQKEDLLLGRIQGYRYTVFKKFKIIYWIDDINKIIVISHVFDTRQNPIKIKKI